MKILKGYYTRKSVVRKWTSHLRVGYVLRIVFIGVVVGAIFLPGYSKYHRMRQENNRLAKAVQELKMENEKLIKEKRLLTQDPVYVEKKARQNLGLVKKGEIIYKFNSQESKTDE